MPANLEYQAQQHWANAFKSIGVKQIFATKLDESYLKGQLLDIILKEDFSLYAVSDSPNLTKSFETINKKILINLLREIYEKYETS